MLASAAAAIAITGGTSMGQEKQPTRAIRRSDIVFMYDNPKRYEAYGTTVLGWAGRRDAGHIAKAHAAGVRRFSCSVGFLTEFKRVIDFSDEFLDAACRNFAGEPYIVPWLWDHKYKHKGTVQPAYWWCTNSPLYRKYLYHRLAETIRAGCDGMHIDDYRGTSGSVTWRAGGFCRHCMAAFREYLGRNVPKAKLAQLGIKDLETFDYRKFLLARGVTPADYNKRRSRLPLAEEFYHFQVMADNAFVGEYHKRAGELAGRPIGLSVNSGLSNPHALVIAPHLSNFCCEVRHNASRRRPATHPVYIYKLASGLGRTVCSTAAGQDWALVSEHKLPGLVRTWVALSYALGHNLMAPHRQWCYTKEKGTHWYDGPTEEYVWPYRFVRSQARLLDGYDAVAPVAVIYSNPANRKGRGRIEAICTALAQANVPFRVVIAGDHWLPDYRLKAADLAAAKAVVAPKQLDLDAAQQKLIDRVAAAGRLVTWPDKDALARLVPAPITIEGAQRVWAVPRAPRGGRTKPAVIHLLNRNYDAKSDAIVPQKRLTLRIRRDLFAGRKLAKATAHAPKARPVELKVASTREHTTVTLPQLDLWTIVELGK
jgi:hypothetical protein